MYSSKVLGLIPARGGSKGIPRKNIRSIGGKPLVAWTIEAAIDSKFIDCVVVTTDDNEIAEVSRKYGAEVPFIRPQEHAQDDSLRNEVVLHALMELDGYDYVILLQPTSPLRSSCDIDEAFDLFLQSNAKSCVSVMEQHPTPEWMFKMNDEKRIVSISGFPKSSNRQTLPKYYSLNGAIYIISVENFFSSSATDPFIGEDVLPYVMPKISSCDIDDDLDWNYVEGLMNLK